MRRQRKAARGAGPPAAAAAAVAAVAAAATGPSAGEAAALADGPLPPAPYSRAALRRLARKASRLPPHLRDGKAAGAKAVAVSGAPAEGQRQAELDAPARAGDVRAVVPALAPATTFIDLAMGLFGLRR